MLLRCTCMAHRWALAALCVAFIGCSSGSGADDGQIPPDSWLADPLQPLPDDFSEVGLYLDGGDPTSVPDRALPYEPRWPLWSSGSEKHRHVVFPEGARVDNTDAQWEFPVGTAFFKTFGYPRDGRFVPVETRVMHVEEDGGWGYEDYAWDAEGRTAQKLDITFSTEVTVETDDGPLTHTIPARLECRECHESAPAFVLGFEAFQLGPQMDGLADVFAEPNPPPGDIDTGDATTDAVLGLFVGQCTHCHNGTDGPSSAFDLRPDVALENTLDVETESSAMAAGIRIIPGDPAGSIIFQAFSGETDDPEVGDMPPLGIDRRDAEAIELLREWIASL